MYQACFSFFQLRTPCKAPWNKVRPWPHDSWRFLWNIPIGQSWAFGEMRNTGCYFLPTFLCPSSPAGFREDPVLWVQGQACGLLWFTRVFILQAICWALSGWGRLLKLRATLVGEESYFPEGPWGNTAPLPLPAALSPFSGGSWNQLHLSLSPSPG